MESSRQDALSDPIIMNEASSLLDLSGDVYIRQQTSAQPEAIFCSCE